MPITHSYSSAVYAMTESQVPASSQPGQRPGLKSPGKGGQRDILMGMRIGAPWPLRSMEIFGLDRDIRAIAIECLELGTDFPSEVEICTMLIAIRPRVQKSISFLLRHRFIILRGRRVREVRI